MKTKKKEKKQAGPNLSALVVRVEVIRGTFLKDQSNLNIQRLLETGTFQC